MIRLIRTNSEDPVFVNLVSDLDTELTIVDGEDHSFYSQFNKIDKIRFVIVAFDDKKPVGCGAIKENGEGIMEVKRMYVTPEKRNRGLASEILKELENWALEMSYNKCILETGKRQPDAISLYKKNGYAIIPNYGQYTGVENSVCFQKLLV
jgi:putative acetyltransferase